MKKTHKKSTKHENLEREKKYELVKSKK